MGHIWDSDRFGEFVCSGASAGHRLGSLIKKPLVLNPEDNRSPSGTHIKPQGS